MGSDDYAFSDENLPEGWPELDIDDIVTGDWLDNKSPSSVALRRYMADMVRFFRKGAPGPAARMIHRQHRAELVAMEQSLAEIHRKFRRDWELFRARPKGGVQ
jgi:hypothetical protein